MTNIHSEITAHRLHSIHITLRDSPFQFVDRRAAISDNPLFTIHNLNPVSHLSSICITILVCPFNKHLLAQKCTSVREWRISPIQIFFRYDPLELLSLCVKPVSPPLCTSFSSFLRLVLVTDCLCDYIFIYFLYSRKLPFNHARN